MNAELEVGQTLDGRFHLTQLINRGGMSSIYKATDFQTGQEVAVKIPLFRIENDPSFFARFDREEEIGRTLKHPAIPYVLPIRDKSRPYIVMEYLEGELLSDAIRRLGTMETGYALDLMARIADAVAFLHEHRIIHRDLKPQNIMVCKDGSLRIIDFGIAKLLGGRKITIGPLASLIGTPDYMAPEQVQGRSVDERADLYSMGAILYEMVTGSPPFEGDNALAVMNARVLGDPVAPRQRNPSVPPQVEEIILHAMERDPKARYATASAFRADLESPTSVPLTGRAERLELPGRPLLARMPRVVFFWALGLGLGFLFFFLVWIRMRRTSGR
jgi:serine/threonine-protein kinase